MALWYAALLWTLRTPHTISAVGSYGESSRTFRVRLVIAINHAEHVRYLAIKQQQQ
jgi:hypothetical protein